MKLFDRLSVLSQKSHRVKSSVCMDQLTLFVIPEHPAPYQALVRHLGSIIHFVHFNPMPTLPHQFRDGLEEVDV